MVTSATLNGFVSTALILVGFIHLFFSVVLKMSNFCKCFSGCFFIGCKKAPVLG